MKKLLIYLPFLLLAIACKKDPDTTDPQPNTEPEQQLPALNMAGLLNYSVPAHNPDTVFDFECFIDVQDVYRQPYHYKYPVFNPGNTNQIAFLRESTDPSKMNIEIELCTFDFSTGQLKVLANNAFYDVQWSSKDWLLYVGSDYNLYKINATGGTPVQLTNTGAYNNFPKWSANGTRISFVDWHGPSFWVTMDESGQRLDTFTYNVQSWYSDSIITTIVPDDNFRSLGYYNINSNLFTTLDKFNIAFGNRHHFIQSLYLFKDKTRMLWNSNYAIAISSNFSRTILKEFSSSWWFEHGASLSPDEKYIIFERTDIEKIDECNRYAKTGIYFMNVDGTNERELKFPE